MEEGVEMVFVTNSVEMGGGGFSAPWQSFVLSVSEAVSPVPPYPGTQVRRNSVALMVHVPYTLTLCQVWGQARGVPRLVLRDEAVDQKAQLPRG